MTKEEICECLKTIVTQIDETVGNRYEGVNATYIADIKPNSLRFVIEEAIKALEQESSGETKNRYKCNQCKYLSDEKCTIGRKCIHPTKVFHTSTAHWKYPSCKACKLFEERTEE